MRIIPDANNTTIRIKKPLELRSEITTKGKLEHNKPLKIPESTRHQILEKIQAASNFRLPKEQITSGITVHVERQGFVRRNDMDRLEDFGTITQAEYDSIEPLEAIRSRIKPLYGADQIEPFYYADKPKARVVLPKLLDPGFAKTATNTKKVVSSTVTEHPRFAFVNIPYYVDSGVNYIEPIDVDPRCLIALLNSSVVWFWIKYGWGHGNTQITMDTRTISSIPLVMPEENFNSVLKKIANDAYNLKKARRTYIDLWRTYSAFFKFNSKKLNAIIDSVRLNGCNPSEPWLLRTELPKPEDHAYRKVFEHILLRPDVTDNSLHFRGESGDVAMDLGALFFSGKELLLHIYCSILSSSHLQNTSIGEMLEETNVPLREEDTERQTDYIFKAVAIDFHNYIMVEKYVTYDFKIIDSEPLDVPENLLGVDRYLADTLAKLDALAFKLYSLSKDEVRIVLESLDYTSVYRKDVLDRFSAFERLDSEELQKEALKQPPHSESEEYDHNDTCNHGSRNGKKKS